MIHRTPTGDRLDGIAPDIEENMDGTDVGAFAQILRAQLGADRLIVGVIYPAGSWIGQQHPIAGILSHSVNVLAPMDYWHDQQGSVSQATVADYVRQSVVDIKDATGNPNFPVAVIGQTYDNFGRDGIGPNNPSSAEINAALRAAQDAGAIGISFFQWGTATPSEWTAIGAFRWVLTPHP